MWHTPETRKRHIQQQVRVALATRPAFRALSASMRAEIEQETVSLLLRVVERNAALLTQVDFPEFVASLIRGAFDAIVDASREQMDAYLALVRSAAKAADAFAEDNVAGNDSRDHLGDHRSRAVKVSPGQRATLLASRFRRGLISLAHKEGRSSSKQSSSKKGDGKS